MRDLIDDYYACQSLTSDSPATIVGLFHGRKTMVFMIGASWHWMVELKEPRKRIMLEPISIEEAAVVIRKMTDLRVVTQERCQRTIWPKPVRSQ